MTPDQIAWLAWGAVQHRPAHSTKWDQASTAKVITDHCASWGFEHATAHVLAHARDPKAKTPGAIKGKFTPDNEPAAGAFRPPKPEQMCQLHGGWLNGCSGCAADEKAGDKTPRNRPSTSDHSELIRSIRDEITKAKTT